MVETVSANAEIVTKKLHGRGILADEGGIMPGECNRA